MSIYQANRMPTYNATAPLNYLEIIFTFTDRPQYIARFGNFNVATFNDEEEFHRFIHDIFELTSSDGAIDSLCKISCFQQTKAEGWDNAKASYRPIDGHRWCNRKAVSNPVMPDWYMTGKWLYNEWARDRLTDAGIDESDWNTIGCVAEHRAVADLSVYHHDDDVPTDEIAYCFHDANCIYFGTFDECPVMDTSNIALFRNDTQVGELTSAELANAKAKAEENGTSATTELVEAEKKKNAERIFETMRMILGEEIVDAILSGATKDDATAMLRDKVRDYCERKGEEFDEQQFCKDFGVEPLMAKDGVLTEKDYNPNADFNWTILRLAKDNDDERHSLLRFIGGDYSESEAVEKAIREHFTEEFIASNTERWEEVGLHLATGMGGVGEER